MDYAKEDYGVSNSLSHYILQEFFSGHMVGELIELLLRPKTSVYNIQSNPVKTDNEGTMESVHINRVSVLSGSCESRQVYACYALATPEVSGIGKDTHFKYLQAYE